jgi:hypothetical protein
MTNRRAPVNFFSHSQMDSHPVISGSEAALA